MLGKSLQALLAKFLLGGFFLGGHKRPRQYQCIFNKISNVILFRHPVHCRTGSLETIPNKAILLHDHSVYSGFKLNERVLLPEGWSEEDKAAMRIWMKTAVQQVMVDPLLSSKQAGQIARE